MKIIINYIKWGFGQIQIPIKKLFINNINLLKNSVKIKLKNKKINIKFKK